MPAAKMHAQLAIAAAAALAVGAAARAGDASDEINPRLLRRFAALRPRLDEGAAPGDAMIQLGRMLFYEPRLSSTGDISCNSCHALDKFGVDGKKFSIGAKGQKGGRNAPTVFNAAGHFQQFWDGRAADVEAQATGPMLNPKEMAMTKQLVEERLRGNAGYAAAFKAAFAGEAEPVTLENAGKAIGAFERGLTTPSRWDKFLGGEGAALTREEKEGFKVFSNVGCVVCHTGEMLGGSTFQRAGVVEPWPNQQDKGRAEVTKADSDKMMFKVPSLRNIARTAPYFHDGSAPDLETAVKMMGKHQLGVDLAPDEVASIVTWLKSLTGEVDGRYIARPSLPK